MTKRRIILIAAVIAVLVAAAAAGAYLYMNRFDAGEYVQAVLDVSYRNKTDKYVEITGVSEKEAEQIFEDNLDATMKGFETSDMPRTPPILQEIQRSPAHTQPLYPLIRENNRFYPPERPDIHPDPGA